MTIRELQGPYGSVCPLLNLSKHWGVDYTAVLQFADVQLRERIPGGGWTAESEEMMQRSDWPRIAGEILDIVDWMAEQHTEAEVLEAAGRLKFDPAVGKWAVLQ